MNKGLRGSILIADPDESESCVLKEQLVKFGFVVKTVSDENSTLEAIQNFNPDMIIVDIKMNTIDGQNIFDKLKLIQELSNTPIIILTDETDITVDMYTYFERANDYVSKPYKFPEVLARINSLLNLLRIQKELQIKNRELLEKNQLLQQMVITDELTGLFNKRHIIVRLQTEILNSVRYKEPLSCLMIDIDYFKKTNDTYGHLAGDVLLNEIGKIIKTSSRNVDIPGRFGGEEFVIISPRTDEEGAKILGERIRENIENTTFCLGGNNLNVTVSIGIKTSIPETHTDMKTEIDKLVGDADIALYRAKANGRNRIVAYDERLSVYRNPEPADIHLIDTSLLETDEYTN